MNAIYVVALFFGLTIVHVQQAWAVEAWQLQETRLCGPPKRTADGKIYRSAAVRRAFMAQVWCPSTGKFGESSCPDHEVNHNIPLVNCGCDSVANMSLVHVSIKTCAASVNPNCLDRVEQKIWADGCRIWFESQGAFE